MHQSELKCLIKELPIYIIPILPSVWASFFCRSQLLAVKTSRNEIPGGDSGNTEIFNLVKNS